LQLGAELSRWAAGVRGAVDALWAGELPSGAGGGGGPGRGEGAAAVAVVRRELLRVLTGLASDAQALQPPPRGPQPPAAPLLAALPMSHEQQQAALQAAALARAAAGGGGGSGVADEAQAASLPHGELLAALRQLGAWGGAVRGVVHRRGCGLCSQACRASQWHAGSRCGAKLLCSPTRPSVPWLARMQRRHSWSGMWQRWWNLPGAASGQE
jgi:hypothetical protein